MPFSVDPPLWKSNFKWNVLVNWILKGKRNCSSLFGFLINLVYPKKRIWSSTIVYYSCSRCVAAVLTFGNNCFQERKTPSERVVLLLPWTLFEEDCHHHFTYSDPDWLFSGEGDNFKFYVSGCKRSEKYVSGAGIEKWRFRLIKTEILGKNTVGIEYFGGDMRSARPVIKPQLIERLNS